MGLETEKILVLNTRHITEDVASRLDDPNSEISCNYYPRSNREYGWFIPVLDARDPMHEPPKCLKRCLALAEDMGCEWLLLDMDGPRTQALKKYDW